MLPTLGAGIVASWLKPPLVILKSHSEEFKSHLYLQAAFLLLYILEGSQRRLRHCVFTIHEADLAPGFSPANPCSWTHLVFESANAVGSPFLSCACSLISRSK